MLPKQNTSILSNHKFHGANIFVVFFGILACFNERKFVDVGIFYYKAWVFFIFVVFIYLLNFVIHEINEILILQYTYIPTSVLYIHVT